MKDMDILTHCWPGGSHGGKSRPQETGAYRYRKQMISSMLAAAAAVKTGKMSNMPDTVMLSSKQKQVKFHAHDALSAVSTEDCEAAIAYILNQQLCGEY